MGEELFGFLAGGVLAIGFIPQVWRLFRMKSAKEISLPFTLSFVIGISLWLSYGISFSLMPVIIWNAVMLVLGCAMLYAKLKYGR